MKVRSLIALLPIALLLYSCGNEVEPEVPTTDTSVNIDCASFYRYAPESEVQVYVSADEGASFDVSIPSTDSWIKCSTTSSNASGYVSFTLEENKTGKERTSQIEFKYGKNAHVGMKITQDAGTKESHFEEWGLEGNYVSSVSLDKPYEWYIDQGSTGQFSNVNCGPSSVAMAANWYDSSFRVTAKKARSEFRPQGGWWYINTDIVPYLDKHGIVEKSVYFSSKDALIDALDNGHIAIVCLDMNKISKQTGAGSHLGTFYTTSKDWGHFFVVKGYVKTDKVTYFEVYDPYSLGQVFTDHSPKGKDRYYDADEVQRSSLQWAGNMIVIGR